LEERHVCQPRLFSGSEGRSWDDFEPEPISLNEIAGLRKTTSEPIGNVAFDDGPSS
jgi:hypothetical protein